MDELWEELSTIAFRSEDDQVFRIAQLLLLMDQLAGSPIALDRLTCYDFFAENPYLLFDKSDPARARLRLAGFAEGALSYSSPGQRFTTRQERVSGDLALLVAYGLAEGTVHEKAVRYRVTQRGTAIVSGLRSMYADSYRQSAQMVYDRLRRLSDTRLHATVRDSLEPSMEQLIRASHDLGSSDE